MSAAPAVPAARACGGWEALPLAVRRAHEPGTFTARLDIVRRRSLVATLLGFPREGRNVPATLRVEPCGPSQRWTRRIGGVTLVTVQDARATGILAERLGLVECLLALSADARGLTCSPAGAALALGPLRLRLPRLLSPSVHARVEDLPGRDVVHVSVTIAAPLLGVVLSYGGDVRREDDA